LLSSRSQVNRAVYFKEYQTGGDRRAECCADVAGGITPGNIKSVLLVRELTRSRDPAGWSNEPGRRRKSERSQQLVKQTKVPRRVSKLAPEPLVVHGSKMASTPASSTNAAAPAAPLTTWQKRGLSNLIMKLPGFAGLPRELPPPPQGYRIRACGDAPGLQPLQPGEYANLCACLESAFGDEHGAWTPVR
jgi:hypothetical protein